MRNYKHVTATSLKMWNDRVNDSAADRARALLLVRFSSSSMCLLCWTILCSQNPFSFCLSWIRAAFITWQWETHMTPRFLQHVKNNLFILVTEELLLSQLLLLWNHVWLLTALSRLSLSSPFPLSFFFLSSQSPGLCLLSVIPHYSISSCFMSFNVLFSLVHLFLFYLLF